MNKLVITTVALAMATAASVTRAYQPESPECIAPAISGGGWDFILIRVREQFSLT